MITLKIKVDASDHKAALKTARREVGRRTRPILQREGEQHVLPTSRRKVLEHAPARVANVVSIRATPGYAEVTAKRAGALADILGLIEFGGTVREKLLPKTAEAMSTPWGPRAFVAGTRTYKPREGMRAGVMLTLDRYEDAVAEGIEDVLAGEIR